MLLAAWNSGDSGTIQSAISEAHTVQTASLESADAERIELIQAAGMVIRDWMEGRKSAADRDASLTVLRHLVRSGNGVIEIPQGKSRRLREDLQPGRRACARR
jgi:hypothetical protein